MYEWMIKEMADVTWKKFFTFQKDLDPEALAAQQKQFGALPRDYCEFVMQFRESRLFRRLAEGSYNMGVFSHPRIIKGLKGESLLEIGFFINGGGVYFRKQKGSPRLGPGVFEGAGLQLRKSADSFEEWLKKRYASARKLYKKSDWRRILEGAVPFTEDELRIVEAIDKFAFEKAGIASNGNVLIKVHNDSKMRFDYLTIGVRAKGRIEGGGHVNVSRIGPGETKVVEHDCYKQLVPAERIELFRKPLPEPEEREMFYEFGAPEWMPKV